jgi:cold shock CspA family protein
VSDLTQIGIVKWFDDTKGFGIVGGSNNEDYFLHLNSFEGKWTELKKGVVVCFKPGKKKGKKSTPANNCRKAKLSDLPSALKLLKTNREIVIELISRGISRWGNPYKRKRNRTFDILELFFESVFREVDSPDILSELQKAWKDQIKKWSVDQLTSLLNLLARLNRYMDNITIPKDKIAECLKSELLEEQKFELWKLNKFSGFRAGFRDDSSNNGSVDDENDKILVLPFDSKVIEDNFSNFTPHLIKRLNRYKISFETITNLKDKFQNSSINSEDELEKGIAFADLLSEDEKENFRIQLTKRIQPELYLKVWSEPGIYEIDRQKGIVGLIDFEKDIIFNRGRAMRGWNKNDFLPDKAILFKAIHSINKKSATKICSVQDGHSLLSEALLQISNDDLKHKNKVKDIFESVKTLSELNQEKVMKHLTSKLNVDGWKELIQESWIRWKNENLTVIDCPVKLTETQNSDLTQALMYHYNAEQKITHKSRLIANIISYIAPQEYENIFNSIVENIDNNEIIRVIQSQKLTSNQSLRLLNKIDFSEESSSIKALIVLKKNNIDGISDFLEKNHAQILKLNNEGLSELFETWPLKYLKDHLLSSESITNKLVLERLLPSCNVEELVKIKEDINDSELRLETYNEIVALFQEFEVDYFPIKYSTLLNKESKNESVIIAAELCNRYSEEECNKLSDYFKNNIEFDKFNVESDFLKFLRSCFTSEMVERLILSTDSEKLIGYVFQFFREKKHEQLLNEKAFKYVLKHALKVNVSDGLNYLLSDAPEHFSGTIEELNLNERNYKIVFDFIDSNFSEIKASGSIKGEVNLLLSALKSEDKNKSLNYYNNFNTASGFAYQTILILLIHKLVHKNVIPQWHETIIFEKSVIKQLGSKLISQFNKSSGIPRETLMKELNVVLKEHFKVLDNLDFKKNEFQNLFSINHLVKGCDGRKTIYGLDLWKRGNIERYYTKGNHGIKKGLGEGIYCEGRHWKTIDIWSSESNKPTGMSQTLYWCKRSSCAGVNTISDLELPVSKWTLSEISEIKSTQIDRLFFTNLAGWLNRMNSIFNRLHCYECENILRPMAFVPKQLGFYAVPLFQCVNDKCIEYEKKIRFTHCRGCKKILDSRECQTCDKCNWLECDDDSCGKCGCSSDHVPKYAQY